MDTTWTILVVAEILAESDWLYVDFVAGGSANLAVGPVDDEEELYEDRMGLVSQVLIPGSLVSDCKLIQRTLANCCI